MAPFHTDTHFTHITLMGWAKYHSNQAPPLGVWGVFKWSVGNVVFLERRRRQESVCKSESNPVIQNHQR